jgi:hypothetical protein
MGDKMEKSQVLDLVAALRDRFPRQAKDFGARNAQAYCEDLVDLDYSAALVAVRTLAATLDWFPSIAEIRKTAAEYMSPVPDADRAWCDALKYGNRVGWGNHREFDSETGGYKPLPLCDLHPAVIAAVEGLGGWRELGRSKNQEIDRAHFLKLYATTKDRHLKEVVTRPLISSTEKRLLNGKINNETESKEPTSTKRLGKR